MLGAWVFVAKGVPVPPLKGKSKPRPNCRQPLPKPFPPNHSLTSISPPLQSTIPLSEHPITPHPILSREHPPIRRGRAVRGAVGRTQPASRSPSPPPRTLPRNHPAQTLGRPGLYSLVHLSAWLVASGNWGNVPRGPGNLAKKPGFRPTENHQKLDF